MRYLATRVSVRSQGARLSTEGIDVLQPLEWAKSQLNFKPSVQLRPLQLLYERFQLATPFPRKLREYLRPALRRPPETGRPVLQSRLANRMRRNAERFRHAGSRDLMAENVCRCSEIHPFVCMVY